MISNEDLFNNKYTLEQLKELLLTEPDNTAITYCIEHYDWYQKELQRTDPVYYSSVVQAFSSILTNKLIAYLFCQGVKKIIDNDKKVKRVGSINTDPDFPIILVHDLGNINI
jgi:hypothetical protein